MSSGHCDFCGIWHSASCCHPGQVVVARLEARIKELEAAPEITVAAADLDPPTCSRCGFACHTICPKCTGVVEPRLAV